MWNVRVYSKNPVTTLAKFYSESNFDLLFNYKKEDFVNFQLTDEETRKAISWMDTHRVDPNRYRVDPNRCGAIGGQFTFKFTPTSLGTIASIRDNISKEGLTLTDFSDF